MIGPSHNEMLKEKPGKGCPEQEVDPLVSICVPTYNVEKTVKQTLESILKQTYRNIEVLVVDNASTDNTVSLLQEIDEPRIRIHCNDMNIGAEKNFSKCVQLANGEYTAIFHADDLYMPNMIEKQVRVFQDDPSVGAVFTLASRINARGETAGEARLPAKLKGKGVYYFAEVFLSLLGNGNFLVCPSAMVRSKIYKQLVPFAEERFGTSADLDMWLRILERHPIAILEDKLMHYRVSRVHGSYKYNYLRTEQAAFFKVMDYYLSAQSEALDIPCSVLNKYESRRRADKIMCAINHLNKGELQEGTRLLRKSFPAMTFRGVRQTITRPKLLFLNILLLSAGPLRQYLAKSLHWLLRWRGRRIV